MSGGIDDRGRCCGRKPFAYKGGSRSVNGPKAELFCGRCCRSYSPETKGQINNWAWKKADDGSFQATYPTHDYARPGK